MSLHQSTDLVQDSEIDKVIIIDALCGAGLGFDDNFINPMVKLGIAEFYGNQNNEGWRWIRDKLDKLEYSVLWNLYASAKLSAKNKVFEKYLDETKLDEKENSNARSHNQG